MPTTGEFMFGFALMAAVGATAVVAGGFGIYSVVNYASGKNAYHTMPRDVKLKEGFVQPSRLEILLKDIDNDGKNEIIMTYNNSSYLLTTNEEGKVVAKEYSIIPAKVIPAQLVYSSVKR